MDRGADPIPNREGLEESFVEEYENGRTPSFQDETLKAFIEYREGHRLKAIDNR